MNKLLIHNNISAFNNEKYFSIGEQFVFDVDLDKDVDFYIEEQLIGKLKKQLEVSDVVFINISLSQNYLEYLGLRLAYHIRLTKSLEDKAYIPIILIGEESFQFLGLTYTEPSILFTKGIYLIKETPFEYEKIKKIYELGNLKSLEDFNEFINTININPPANYQSHHSIANEWSILSWAKILNIEENNTSLISLEKNIGSLLYYKFLLLKFPIDKKKIIAPFNITTKGKILYIDDEWNKGWKIVLNKFFENSAQVSFEVFETTFKDKLQNNLISDCIDKVKLFGPDIVLLDLRLLDCDFEQIDSKKLTGYKILNAIKDINPGIQVIIFTASNKVWNLIQLQDAKANGFVLKESPEINNITYINETLSSFKNQVEKCLEKSFLKEVWNFTVDIKKILSNKSLSAYTGTGMSGQIIAGNYKNILISELDAIYDILNTNNENRFNHSMLMLYKILEYLNEIFFKNSVSGQPATFYDGTLIEFYDKTSSTWKKSSDKVSKYDKVIRKTEQVSIKVEWINSTTNKTLNVIVQKLHILDNTLLLNIISFSEYRNDFIHPEAAKRISLQPISSNDILTWTRSINKIFQKI